MLPPRDLHPSPWPPIAHGGPAADATCRARRRPRAGLEAPVRRSNAARRASVNTASTAARGRRGGGARGRPAWGEETDERRGLEESTTTTTMMMTTTTTAAAAAAAAAASGLAPTSYRHARAARRRQAADAPGQSPQRPARVRAPARRPCSSALLVEGRVVESSLEFLVAASWPGPDGARAWGRGDSLVVLGGGDAAIPEPGTGAMWPLKPALQPPGRATVKGKH